MTTEKIFLDCAEELGNVYWLGIPYVVESSFGGRFLHARTMFDEEITDYELEGNVLHKFFKMSRVRPKAILPQRQNIGEWRDL